MSAQYLTVKYTAVQYSTIQCNSDMITMLRDGNPTLCLSSVLVLIKETGLPVHLLPLYFTPNSDFPVMTLICDNRKSFFWCKISRPKRNGFSQRLVLVFQSVCSFAMFFGRAQLQIIIKISLGL